MRHQGHKTIMKDLIFMSFSVWGEEKKELG